MPYYSYTEEMDREFEDNERKEAKKKRKELKMTEVKLIYTISNNGDGSASVKFHSTEADAKLACKIEESYGEAFCENYPIIAELAFDVEGVLINPTNTKEELLETLKENK